MLRTIAAAAVLAALLPATALSEGLCQVRFDGSVSRHDAALRKSVGHLVEVEIGALAANPKRDARELVLHLHLAHGTTGDELARLVAKRLARLDVDVLHTEGAEDGSGASLWIESAQYVRLRLGGGLGAEVACSEGPPTALRVLPPSAIETPASLIVSASTALVLRDRPPMREVAALELELGPESSSAEVAAKLSEAAASVWVGERPRGDAWRPHRMVDGATITGVSVGLSTAEHGGGDWRIEVEL